MPTNFQKAVPNCCGVMLFLVGYELINPSRCESLPMFLNSFFILLYYSYKMYIQYLERLHPAVMEICYILKDMKCTTCKGEILLFFLNSFSIIATKHIYKTSKGCAQQLESYEMTCAFRENWISI